LGGWGGLAYKRGCGNAELLWSVIVMKHLPGDLGARLNVFMKRIPKVVCQEWFYLTQDGWIDGLC
jgi:hypothetical protein